MQLAAVPNELHLCLETQILSYQFIKMCVLIRHKQSAKFWWKWYNWSLITCENVQKTQQNPETFHNLKLYPPHQHIRTCALILETVFKSLVKTCVTKHKWRSFLWYFVCRHKAMFSNWKSRKSRIHHVKINLNSIR